MSFGEDGSWELTAELAAMICKVVPPIGALLKVEHEEEEEEILEETRSKCVAAMVGTFFVRDDDDEFPAFTAMMQQLVQQFQDGSPTVRAAICRLLHETLKSYPFVVVSVNEGHFNSLVESIMAVVADNTSPFDLRMELAFSAGHFWDLLFPVAYEQNVPLFREANDEDGAQSLADTHLELFSQIAFAEDTPLPITLALMAAGARLANTAQGTPVWQAHIERSDDKVAWGLALIIGSRCALLDATNETTRQVWRGLRDLVEAMQGGDESADREAVIHYCISIIPHVFLGLDDFSLPDDEEEEPDENEQLGIARANRGRTVEETCEMATDAVSCLMYMVEVFRDNSLIVVSVLSALALFTHEAISIDVSKELLSLLISFVHKPVEWVGEEFTEQDWSEDDDLDVGFQGQTSMSLALDNIDSICKVYPDEVFSFLWPQLQRMVLNNDDEFEQRAGFFVLSALLEGCIEYVGNHLEDISAMTMRATENKSGFVRHAACNALGQMATDLQPLEFSDKSFTNFAPRLIKLLDDPCARVVSHAASVLINFFSEMTEESAEQFVLPTMTKFAEIAQNPPSVYVQESIITAVASVALKVDDFSEFYSHFMKPLLTVIRTADPEDYQQLRSRCWECAGVLVQHVSHDEGKADAETLLNLAFISPEYEQLSKGIANKTTADFASHLMRFTYATNGEVKAEELENIAMQWLFQPPTLALIPEPHLRKEYHVAVPGVPVMLTTHDAEIKSIFTDIIVLLPEFSEVDAFVAASIFNLSSTLLSCFDELTERIKSTLGAFAMLGLTIEHAKALMEKCPEQFLHDDQECMEFWDAFLSSHKRKGTPCEETSVILHALNEPFVQFAQELLAVFQSLQELEEEPMVFSELYDSAFHAFISMDTMCGHYLRHEVTMFQLLEDTPAASITCRFLGIYDELTSPQLKTLVICAFANFLDSKHPLLRRYLKRFMPLVVDGVVTGNIAMKQASAYCLGMTAYVQDIVPDVDVEDYCVKNLDTLKDMIDGYQARESSEMSFARDNAISAYTHICKTFKEPEEFMPTLLGFLPLSGDVEESVLVITYLCEEVGKSITDGNGLLDEFLLGVMATFSNDEFQSHRDWAPKLMLETIVGALEKLPSAQEQHSFIANVLSHLRLGLRGNWDAFNGQDEE